MGTVREDYSAHRNGWDYLPQDRARSRAYRRGEDGSGGFSDVEQRLCLSVALWNGRDPILGERLFGLTDGEGNHGEDVKGSPTTSMRPTRTRISRCSTSTRSASFRTRTWCTRIGGAGSARVFDRSAELPTGGIDQSDGTSWMAMCSLNMMHIALPSDRMAQSKCARWSA